MIHVLKSTVSDNFFYLVKFGGEAALVDPIDHATAIAAVKESGATLRYVLNTHFHPDHVGGNGPVLAAFPDAQLIAGPDASRIDGVQREVSDGDSIELGGATFDVVETPGHTQGHVTFVWTEDGVHLFSGDTIFVAGAGNCRFGGDPGVLYQTFANVLPRFSDDAVFYPGHDYALNNLKFAQSVDRETDFSSWFERSESTSPTLCSLGDERSYNPFFRFADERLKSQLVAAHEELFLESRQQSHDDHEAVFRTLRSLRNDW